MNLDLSTDAPPSPERTLQLAETIAEAVRVLGHATRHHEALRWPSDADRLIRELSLAVSRLPQLLEQVSGWLEAEAAAGRIEMDAGQWAGRPGLAAEVARMKLEQAQAHARMLEQALDAAASVTSGMGARGDAADDR